MKTGTNAAYSAALANRFVTSVGTWKAIVNAENGPLVPKNFATEISRTSPAMRENPDVIVIGEIRDCNPAEHSSFFRFSVFCW